MLETASAGPHRATWLEPPRETAFKPETPVLQVLLARHVIETLAVAETDWHGSALNNAGFTSLGHVPLTGPRLPASHKSPPHQRCPQMEADQWLVGKAC